jgi:hypothetical protein
MRSLGLFFFITWILAVSVLSRGDILVSIFHAQWLTWGTKVKNKLILDTSKVQSRAPRLILIGLD